MNTTNTHNQILDLKNRMAKAIIGQQQVIEQLLIALLANGHVLLEGLPGLAKTRTIKTLAANLESDFSPYPVHARPAAQRHHRHRDLCQRGQHRQVPVPARPGVRQPDPGRRDQPRAGQGAGALLEAMEERQVTVAGTSHALPALFLVLATQNPIEQEGTYPLPEAQMDRFLLHIKVGLFHR
jgi:MoxR-like ATPase